VTRFFGHDETVDAGSDDPATTGGASLGTCEGPAPVPEATDGSAIFVSTVDYLHSAVDMNDIGDPADFATFTEVVVQRCTRLMLDKTRRNGVSMDAKCGCN
jgi:hypothetical protein